MTLGGRMIGVRGGVAVMVVVGAFADVVGTVLVSSAGVGADAAVVMTGTVWLVVTTGAGGVVWSVACGRGAGTGIEALGDTIATVGGAAVVDATGDVVGPPDGCAPPKVRASAPIGRPSNRPAETNRRARPCRERRPERRCGPAPSGSGAESTVSPPPVEIP